MKIELRGNYPLLVLTALILLASVGMIVYGLIHFDYWAGLVLLITACLQALSFIKPTSES
jgi:hypothetical protein